MSSHVVTYVSGLYTTSAGYPQHGFYKHAVIDGWSAIVSLAYTQGLNFDPLGIG